MCRIDPILSSSIVPDMKRDLKRIATRVIAIQLITYSDTILKIRSGNHNSQRGQMVRKRPNICFK